jgi:hypothetical protein
MVVSNSTPVHPRGVNHGMLRLAKSQGERNLAEQTSIDAKDSSIANQSVPVTGGCLCGVVRYESTAPPDRGTYCHCTMCQKN